MTAQGKAGIAPVVSVLMTCFNRARYLPAAIESVLAQSFQDFELLISDDASTDGSLELAMEWAARDSRIRVSGNAAQLGDYPNRNQVASLARGEFIKYLDSDDLMYPYCLDVMVSLMRSNPAAGMGISLLRRHTGGPCPMLLTPRMSYQREFLGAGLFSGSPGAAIIRRDLFDSVGRFPLAGNASDDLFWLSACAKTDVLLLPADLTWYRIHPERQSSQRRSADDYFVVAKAAWESLESPDCPLLPDERTSAKNAVAARLAKHMARDVARGNLRRALRRYRASGIKASQLARHLRPLKLDAMMGTPVADDGSFLIPDWVRRPSQSAE
jgi:glycosyltransferase involved in cell wall biosynthesis